MKKKIAQYIILFSLVIGTGPWTVPFKAYAEEEIQLEIEEVEQKIPVEESETISENFEVSGESTESEETPLKTEAIIIHDTQEDSVSDTSVDQLPQENNTNEVSIVPFATEQYTITSDGLGEQPIAGDAYYDFPTYVNISGYAGSLGTATTYTWELYDLSNGQIVNLGVGTYDITGNQFDVASIIPGGIPTTTKEYFLSVIVTFDKNGIIRTDSIGVSLNYEKVVAKVTIDKPVNPDSIILWAEDGNENERTEATTTWTIKNEDGTPYLDTDGNYVTGVGTSVPKAVIDSLPVGRYQVTNDASQLTQYGHDHTEMHDSISAPFEITGGKLTVHYILRDKDGNEIQEFDTTPTQSGKVGFAWPETGTPSVSVPEGYVLVEGPVTKDADGNVVPTTNTYGDGSDDHLYYYYGPIETKVTVNYQDEEGNSIRVSETETGSYGEHYEKRPPQIPGYTLKELKPDSDPSEGMFDIGDKTITYVYEKNPANLLVNHIDEYGNVLAPQESSTEKYGNQYFTEQQNIPGYKLIAVPANATGTYPDGTEIVTYMYRLIVPKVDDIVEGSKVITGTGVPEMNVIVTFPDGTEVTVPVNSDGTWSVEVPDNIYLQQGSEVTAVTQNPQFGTISASAATKVIPVVLNESDAKDPLSEIAAPSSNAVEVASATTKKLPNTGDSIWQMQNSFMIAIMMIGAALIMYSKR